MFKTVAALVAVVLAFLAAVALALVWSTPSGPVEVRFRQAPAGQESGPPVSGRVERLGPERKP